RMQPTEYIVTIFAGLCQLCGIYVVLVNIALVHRKAHHWRPLYRCQVAANNRLPLRLKLKLQCYFEKLTSCRKIGVTIGSSSIISTEGCVKVWAFWTWPQ